MKKQFLRAFVLGCSALFLASCANKTEPKVDAPPGKGTTLETPAKMEAPPAKADPREVKLHVDGMSERLQLT